MLPRSPGVLRNNAQSSEQPAGQNASKTSRKTKWYRIFASNNAPMITDINLSIGSSAFTP